MEKQAGVVDAREWNSPAHGPGVHPGAVPWRGDVTMCYCEQQLRKLVGLAMPSLFVWVPSASWKTHLIVMWDPGWERCSSLSLGFFSLSDLAHKVV